MIPAEVLALLEPLVKRFEGRKLEAYQDPGGVWTQGWGHTGSAVSPGVPWTQEYADQILCTDLDTHYTQLLADTHSVDLTTGQSAALTDFVYNLGSSTFLHSTLHLRVLEGDWVGVKLELHKWTHDAGKVLPGLVLRRQAEIDLIDA